MNIRPSFTNIRSFTSYRFSMLRTRVLRDSFWAKLTGRSMKLVVFPKEELRNNPNRRLLGIKAIPVDEIIGTFDRVSDFDNQFRPLSKHMCNRWINACINLEHDGWSPILVHKIGEHYHVEDGHHRGKSLGVSSQTRQTEICPSSPCAERRFAKVYATQY